VTVVLGIAGALASVPFDRAETPSTSRGVGRLALPESPATDPAQPSSSRIQIVSAFATSRDAGVDVVGFDPGAPRDIELWQVDEHLGVVSRVARTRSRPDGGFVAEHLLISQRGVRLVATPVGGDALSVDPSRSMQYAARRHAPPAAWREGGDLVVGLAPAAQALVLADASGREVARLEVPAASRRGATWRRDIASLGVDAPIARIARETANDRDPLWHPVPVAAVPFLEEAP
jgi:hypothetical protein